MRSSRPSLAAFLLWALLVTAWCPAHADAQTGHIAGPIRLDLHASVDLHASLGPGIRLDAPLSRDGLIAAADDELALTFGLDALVHTHEHHEEPLRHHEHEGDLTLLLPLALQWSFMLRHNWSIFPEAGVAFALHDDHAHVLLDVAFGARWHFRGGRAAMLLRVTRPGGFQVGLTW